MAKQIKGLKETNFQERLTGAYAEIVQVFREMGYNSPVFEANFDGTPARAARATQQLIKPRTEIHSDILAMLKKTFPSESLKDMVTSHNNQVFGMCPHHLLPVIMKVSIAYIPKEEVIGISKLTRIAKLLAGRPVLQEQFTHELADIFYKQPSEEGAAVIEKVGELVKSGLSKEEQVKQLGEHAMRIANNAPVWPAMETHGSAVVVEALHMCMACRGVEMPQARIITAAVRGAFKSQPETRKEFYDQVNGQRVGLLG
jgi:GTP cyclohydrolase IA